MVVTRAGNAMRNCERAIDRCFFPLFLKKKAMRCECFCFFASHSHFRIALNFSRFCIFASHKKKICLVACFDLRHFPLNPWVFLGTKVCGDLKLLPNRSTGLLIQSHAYLSSQKKVQLSDANAKTRISNANANEQISDRSMRRFFLN